MYNGPATFPPFLDLRPRPRPWWTRSAGPFSGHWWLYITSLSLATPLPGFILRTMEFPEPLVLSALQHTHPIPDTNSALPHTTSRRRRTSLSGKLLDLLTPEPKSPPKPPPRPVIARPQPLESRIPVRQKRESRQAANDENDPVSPSLSPRPRSRLRLASSTSVDTVHDHDHDSREKLHSPPRPERAVRLYKGVLMKSASENQSHTPLDSRPPSHPRASSEPEQHNHSRAASVLATSSMTSKLRIKEP